MKQTAKPASEPTEGESHRTAPAAPPRDAMATLYAAATAAIDRYAMAEEAGDEDAMAAAQHDHLSATNAMDEMQATTRLGARAEQDGTEPVAASQQLPSESSEWLRLPQACEWIIGRHGERAPDIIDDLREALRGDFPHRVEGWNARTRQWDFRPVPFHAGYDGRRIVAWMKEVAGHRVQVQDWDLARVDWDAGTVRNFGGHRSAIEVQRAHLREWVRTGTVAPADLSAEEASPVQAERNGPPFPALPLGLPDWSDPPNEGDEGQVTFDGRDAAKVPDVQAPPLHENHGVKTSSDAAPRPPVASAPQVKQKSRVPNSYAAKDAALVREMEELIRSGEARGPWHAAEKVAERAAGGGTTESKMKRLTRRYSERLIGASR